MDDERPDRAGNCDRRGGPIQPRHRLRRQRWRRVLPAGLAIVGIWTTDATPAAPRRGGCTRFDEVYLCDSAPAEPDRSPNRSKVAERASAKPVRIEARRTKPADCVTAAQTDQPEGSQQCS